MKTSLCNRPLRVIVATIASLVAFLGPAAAQVKTRISIATGTGDVYYPLGGGMAALISKHIPNTEVTAEVTTASVDNVKLLHGNRVALALSLPDTAWDGFNGKIKGLPERAHIRALMALYSNYMPIVATDGSGINAAGLILVYPSLWRM
jgi:TRAP transporter TAXI family solute receptor